MTEKNKHLASGDWAKYTRELLVDVWLMLICWKGPEDLDFVKERFASLRHDQKKYEKKYLDQIYTLYFSDPKTAALELIGLYHLAKAAEILAIYLLDGTVEGDSGITERLEKHFGYAERVCEYRRQIFLEPMLTLCRSSAMKRISQYDQGARG